MNQPETNHKRAETTAKKIIQILKKTRSDGRFTMAMADAGKELEALANDIATQARDDEHAFWEVERVKLQERANAQLEQFVGEVKERLKVGGRRGAEGFYIISIIDTLATKYLQSGKGEQ